MTLILAVLGFAITNVVSDAHSALVFFETDVEPPYVVAAFAAEETGMQARWPLDYTVSQVKMATVFADFTRKATVYVQVFDSTRLADTNFVVRTDAEREEMYASVKDSLDPRSPIPKKDYWGGEYGRGDMEIVDDHIWGMFKPSNAGTFTLTTRMRGPARTSTNTVQTAILTVTEWESNCLSHVVSEPTVRVITNRAYSASVTNAFTSASVFGGNLEKRIQRTDAVPLGDFRDIIRPEWEDKFTDDACAAEYTLATRSFGPYDTSVGTGYRILYDDRIDEYRIERAYSLHEDRSAEVAVRTPFRSLSSNGSLKIGRDYLGGKIYYVETNSVPGRIYWEGL